MDPVDIDDAEDGLLVSGYDAVLHEIPFLPCLLLGTFMLENDVAQGAPEIPPVGGEGAGMVCFDISFLRSLDVFQGDGGVLVVVEGG